ncbi:hypothetical protein SERLA73DRAFT_186721 [Serpula lacrymans var. lacrymans S7.3]|uniref:Uncharacterized protein n=2 Tax=Serpula lacrymans var. lacrymans TaxID=341189 RepID=F8Q7S7_SERL3|nr:uncharacterized protein SERLADRAFT_475919 [Serpula lacrymans var. lacrymans S7.9]EGN95615.1 hypothetical protein SERLA73DRAFT_186721 [Serpula lacrymans var. lacrymans S7.3]EGO21143.1 hypothetical protein SERLADRAFT_475919 [Serpula lacrymans var. lacrymans S7.9]
MAVVIFSRSRHHAYDLRMHSFLRSVHIYGTGSNIQVNSISRTGVLLLSNVMHQTEAQLGVQSSLRVKTRIVSHTGGAAVKCTLPSLFCHPAG